MERKDDQINIVIIDDHKLFREGVKRILEFESDFNVVAEGEDGNVAVELVEQYKPDVILMDINMPDINGVEATADLVQTFPSTKVIILSIHDDEHYVMHALKTGAQGYLLKEMDSDSLVEAIRVVSAGGSYLHTKVIHNVVDEYCKLVNENDHIEYGYINAQLLHVLTKRECEVLQLLAEGKSTRAISLALENSEKTVKNHGSNVLQKSN